MKLQAKTPTADASMTAKAAHSQSEPWVVRSASATTGLTDSESAIVRPANRIVVRIAVKTLMVLETRIGSKLRPSW